MTLSEELQWRGFIQQSTFDDIHKLDEKKWTFYHGFDASADSQTVGNLAAMMFDKVFMRHGSKAIILAGGATSLIGDPGGKDSERPMQDESTIAHNIQCAQEQLKKIFSGYDFTLVNNLDWTKDLRLLDFLRDIGKYYSMTPLVQRDYIAKRLGDGGTGISYTEFSYTLLQGMDYLHLFDEFGCTLQFGGSDQWGNCLSGVDLIRKARGAEAHVITHPLVINKATGKKFGKSESGAVWLDANKTSVYQFYQFWLNADDEGVEGYIKVFTELDKEAVDGVMTEFRERPGERKAQKTLAYEVTKLVHGQDQADRVKKVTETLFGNDDLRSLSSGEWAIIGEELPVIRVRPGDDLVKLLVDGQLAASNTEARRFLSDSAVYINNEQFSMDKATIGQEDAINGHALLRRGRNQQILLEFV